MNRVHIFEIDIGILLIHRMEYPGVGPELSFLKESGRAEFCVANDEEALDGTPKT